jgi:hypothetical protein
MRTNYFAAILFISIISCSKNDGTIDLRRIFFKENTDTLNLLLRNYNPFISLNKFTFFSEDFNSNANRWPIYAQGANSSNMGGFARIQNGEYYLSGSGDSKIRSFLISKQIDTGRNFEITFRLKNEGFYSDKNLFSGQGLVVVGGLSAGNLIGTGLFLTSVRVKNEISLRKMRAFESTGIFYDINAPNDYFKITLRKIKNRMSVFVNEKFISIYSSGEIYVAGNSIGFAVVDKLYVDYLKIEYLNY